MINKLKHFIKNFAYWKWKCCNCETPNELGSRTCTYWPCGHQKCSNCKEVGGW